MRATQAVSRTLKWPNGRTETIDFDAAINDRIRDLDEPIGRLQEILVQDVQERIRYPAALQAGGSRQEPISPEIL